MSDLEKVDFVKYECIWGITHKVGNPSTNMELVRAKHGAVFVLECQRRGNRHNAHIFSFTINKNSKLYDLRLAWTGHWIKISGRAHPTQRYN